MAFSYSSWFKEGVDPRLLELLQKAADGFEYDIMATSGKNPRKGNKGFHPKGMAVDVRLIDPNTGKVVPNYQNSDSFRTYEMLAQRLRSIQQKEYPDLNNKLRWGGYFSGGKKKYGALDLMHFDLGGGKVGMGGGNWDQGLTPAQRKLWPGAVSIGMANQEQPMWASTSPPNTSVAPQAGQLSPDQPVAPDSRPPQQMAVNPGPMPAPPNQQTALGPILPGSGIPVDREIPQPKDKPARPSIDGIHAAIQKMFPGKIPALDNIPQKLAQNLAKVTTPPVSPTTLPTDQKSTVGKLGNSLVNLAMMFGGSGPTEAPQDPVDRSSAPSALAGEQQKNLMLAEAGQLDEPSLQQLATMTPQQIAELKRRRELAGLSNTMV